MTTRQAGKLRWASIPVEERKRIMLALLRRRWEKAKEKPNGAENTP